MAKRLSIEQINEIVRGFSNGKTIDELSNKFNYTKLTITRQLKKNLGEEIYKTISKKNFLDDNLKPNKDLLKEVGDNLNNQKINSSKNQLNKSGLKKSIKENKEEDFSSLNTFREIVPLEFMVENNDRKDFSSVPLDSINLPKIVYMIVDKKIELEIKILNDFPQWHFLSEKELKRKTIEIFYDLKLAKRACSKDQKVIKVPNTKVFKIVSPTLISRGITRIISEDTLISL